LRKLQYQLFYCEVWNIGVCDVPISAFVDPKFTPRPRWLQLPVGRYISLADPFPGGDRNEVLCEYLNPWTTNRGTIVRVNLGEDSEPVVVIHEPWHLSYPYTCGPDACLVEAYRSGVLSLYGRSPGSQKWMKMATLLDFPAVDPTIVRWNDRWWLFATLPQGKNMHAHNANLHVWHADEMFGPWRAHRRNPVKNDIATARPAGTPFVHDGKLYRPAQDCSRTYGGAINLMEVKTLSEDEFREDVARTILPVAPYTDGVHTLSAFGDRTLIDGKRDIFAPNLLPRRVIRRSQRQLRAGYGRLFGTASGFRTTSRSGTIS
jgi:hypothetical protein